MESSKLSPAHPGITFVSNTTRCPRVSAALLREPVAHGREVVVLAIEPLDDAVRLRDERLAAVEGEVVVLAQRAVQLRRAG